MTLVSWSGGKDAALALDALRRAGEPVEALLVTVEEGTDLVGMHGVPLALVEAQAARLGLPLAVMRVERFPANARYEAALADALAPWRARGVTTIAYGDLFLDDVRAFRDGLLDRLGCEARYPLWGRDTAALARAAVEDGWRAALCVTEDRTLGAGWCGRAWDHAFLDALPAGVDPCGERGEFHTFVHDGPIFPRPLAVHAGPPRLRDGFWFSAIELST